MSDFFKGRKCSICGKDATRAHFGRFLCDSNECIDQARETRDCAGKTIKQQGTVSGSDLLKKK